MSKNYSDFCEKRENLAKYISTLIHTLTDLLLLVQANQINSSELQEFQKRLDNLGPSLKVLQNDETRLQDLSRWLKYNAAVPIQRLARRWLKRKKALAEERSRIQAKKKDIFPSESEAKASWEKQMAGLRDRQRRGEYRIGDSRLTDGPCAWWN
jgi:hypothetical protein